MVWKWLRFLQLEDLMRISRKPKVGFRHYWHMVHEQPNDPPETYHCSYLVRWINQVDLDFMSTIGNAESIFKKKRDSWNKSASCQMLRSQLAQLLGNKKVTKVICFGLGDMCRQPPEGWGDLLLVGMIQHSVALTIAEVCRDRGSSDVQLLAQDPEYSEPAKELLQENGFTIVGQFGAAGFAEIDDKTVVFSAFVSAPLKQIIADIARPALITCVEIAME